MGHGAFSFHSRYHPPKKEPLSPTRTRHCRLPLPQNTWSEHIDTTPACTCVHTHRADVAVGWAEGKRSHVPYLFGKLLRESVYLFTVIFPFYGENQLRWGSLSLLFALFSASSDVETHWSAYTLESTSLVGKSGRVTDGNWSQFRTWFLLHRSSTL